MPDAVTDTHALIWYLQDDPRLSPAAGRVFDACETDGGRVRVPVICVVEIVYLAEKGRIPRDTLDRLLGELAAPDTVLQVMAMDLAVTLRLREVPRDTVPDLPDRIIATSALHWRLPLISRDRRVRMAQIETIW